MHASRGKKKAKKVRTTTIPKTSNSFGGDLHLVSYRRPKSVRGKISKRVDDFQGSRGMSRTQVSWPGGLIGAPSTRLCIGLAQRQGQSVRGERLQGTSRFWNSAGMRRRQRALPVQPCLQVVRAVGNLVNSCGRCWDTRVSIESRAKSQTPRLVYHRVEEFQLGNWSSRETQRTLKAGGHFSNPSPTAPPSNTQRESHARHPLQHAVSNGPSR